MENILEIENLGLNLGSNKVFTDVSFTISSGEVTAVIGPNGCGKTSLAYSIMGLKEYLPEQGSILYKNENINKYSIDERARKGITLAWQEPPRLEGVSVRKFLALGLESQKKEVTEQQLELVLKEVGMSPRIYLDRDIDDTLSGGERKRIELASILIMEPELVILDEPDSGVDIVALNNIGTVINKLKEKNTGILMITHSEEMLKYADKAVLLCHGEILKKGDPQEISVFYQQECRDCEVDDYDSHREKRQKMKGGVKDIG